MCGEKLMFRHPLHLQKGSPPHVRGKGDSDFWTECQSGITPACAGKRPLPAAAADPLRDHPRMCGEKLSNVTGATINQGSPPHVRGKVFGPAADAVAAGITPAHVGKSAVVACRNVSVQDHPRTCGEKFTGERSGSCRPASPPHVRGKVMPYSSANSWIGITPACAGKSSTP